MATYKGKQVSFDTDNERESELFRKLQKLPHGEFSRISKEFWSKEISRRENSNAKSVVAPE